MNPGNSDKNVLAKSVEVAKYRRVRKSMRSGDYSGFQARGERGVLQQIPTPQFDTSAKFADLCIEDGCLAFQLINGDGNFNDMGLEDFASEVNLNKCRSYAVVAIMGPQSSGKSTLLNHLFDTKFTVMDSSSGRSQTTQGIWLATCPDKEPDIKPLMLVMDIEGTDGSEREDDTAFEKRSALFALAVADVVIVNMWCHDIGREQGANKPLLRAVFQQVQIKFCDKPRKIKLMFVIRDKEKSPEDILERSLRANIETIWASIPKPSESSNFKLNEVFDVQVEFLPHYEYQKEDFKLEVQNFKKRLVDYCTAPGGNEAVGDQKQPASGFSTFAQNIWKDIKENKNLDLPAHKDMVATIRCEEIKNEHYDFFEMSEGWFELRKATQLGNFRSVDDLWKRVNSILNTCVSKYDEEAKYFVQAITTKKRQELEDKLLQLVEPVYRALLNHLRLEHLKKFMEAFDKNSDEQNTFATAADDFILKFLDGFDTDCEAISIDLSNWDTLKETVELQHDMSSYIASKREDKLVLKIKQIYEPKLKQELSPSVGHFLCEETDPTWSKIKEHYKIVMNSTVSSLEETFLELGVNEDDKKEKLESLRKYAEDVIVAKAREESGRVETHMMKKFLKLFKYGSSRDSNSNEEIEAAAKNALSTPLNLLAGLVAIRLEDGDAVDGIQFILASAFLGSEYRDALKELDSPSWEQIQSFRTLITPIQCKESWYYFVEEATVITSQVLWDLERKQKKKPKREKFVRAFCRIIKHVASILPMALTVTEIVVAT